MQVTGQSCRFSLVEELKVSNFSFPAGFHPVWEEDVSFTVLNPDCAFLHILMLDYDFIGDDYIGQVGVSVCLYVSQYVCMSV